jgi:hypothetical protein
MSCRLLRIHALTTKTQEREHKARVREVLIVQRTFVTDRYCIFLFRLIDDRGNELHDYDVIFTAGPQYDQNHLTPGFFKDRQRNQRNPGKLTYYIDYNVMAEWLARPELEGKFGFRIASRRDRTLTSPTIPLRIPRHVCRAQALLRTQPNANDRDPIESLCGGGCSYSHAGSDSE